MRSFLTITFGVAGIRLGGNNLKRRLGVLCALWMAVILGAQAQTNPPLNWCFQQQSFVVDEIPRWQHMKLWRIESGKAY
jgi:hypothetical protein